MAKGWGVIGLTGSWHDSAIYGSIRPMAQFTPLKVAILASGLPGRVIAEKIGKDESSVYRWTNDRRPVPPDVKDAFSRVLTESPAATQHGLDCSVEALFPAAERVAA